MALVYVVVAELLVVLTEGWAGYYQEVIQITSAVVESGQQRATMLHNTVEMVTSTQDNANN